MGRAARISLHGIIFCGRYEITKINIYQDHFLIAHTPGEYSACACRCQPRAVCRCSADIAARARALPAHASPFESAWQPRAHAYSEVHALPWALLSIVLSPWEQQAVASHGRALCEWAIAHVESL